MWKREPRVLGAALTPFNRRKDASGFRDWAAEAASGALAMAGLGAADIDALFVGSESDFFSMQLNPASILASELGLTGASATRVEGGGASGQLAVHGAVNALRSGAARFALVIGVDPSASSLSGDDMRALYGFSFDAWTDGFTGASSTVLYALSYQAFAARHRTTDEDLAAVTIQNRANARHNPGAHLPKAHNPDEIAASPVIARPYRRLHCSPLSDGAAALVLALGQDAPAARRTAPRVAGIGSASDHMHLGARPSPGDFTAKTKAMARACQAADITPGEIGLAEIYDAYAGAQLQGLVALGLSETPARDIRDGAFGPEGRCPVNLSGGLMGQGAPVGATGVGQAASVALMLEGRYPGLAPAEITRYGLADTHGGVCTLSAATILERGPV